MTKEIERIIRGGWWHNDARYCRAAYRNRDEPGLWNSYLGFRPAFRLKRVKR